MAKDSSEKIAAGSEGAIASVHLVKVEAVDSALAPVRLIESAKRYAAGAMADNTRRAYRADWKAFAAFCTTHGVASLPANPSTVALYATSMADAGRKPATIRRAMTGIAQAHRLAGFKSPTSNAGVQDVIRGIRREVGSAQKQAAPILPEQLRALVGGLDRNNRGMRDRALLALGFAGAFRRSELVALDVADLDFTSEGLVVNVRRAKTDQEGTGAKVGIPYGGHPATCPVRTVRAWLEFAGIESGPVFREITSGGVVTDAPASDRAVDRAVKRAAKAAGLAGFSAHSLRAGLATTAAKAGKGDRAIMKQGRWKSRAMVDRYVRDANLFTDNAAAGIGL